MPSLFRSARSTAQLLLLSAGIAVTSQAQENLGWSRDPTKIVGSETCQECHKAATAVWDRTLHHATYINMPQSDKALAIAAKMGIEALDLTTSAKCSQCHFTVKSAGSKPKAISGISCESCHGAAGNWLKMHLDQKVDKAARLADAATKGMNRPGDLYSLFKNCLECHTAPDEDLVNKGGHSAGSNFELLAWSQGEVRHTFNLKETANLMPGKEKSRLLFVLGRALELEYALRGVTKIKDTSGPYAKAMIGRMQISLQYLQQINQAVGGNHPGISGIVAAVGNNVTLETAGTVADSVKKATQEFLAKFDGSDLAALDQYLPAKMKGDPAPYRPR